MSLSAGIIFRQIHTVRSPIVKMKDFGYEEALIQQFLTSVAAVNPAKLMAENFKVENGNVYAYDKVYNLNNGNVYLIGFGKAVLGMAAQCEKIIGRHLKRGVICVPENIRQTFQNNCEFSIGPQSVIEVHEGARNNLPDENAEKGADEIIKLVESINKEENHHLIVLISGGGSALFPKPRTGITLIEKLYTINQLVTSGASITEVNSVRKKLSRVKGGRLACLAYPLKTICFILSDVIDDPLDIIASGPTVPNLNSTAFDVIKKHDLEKKLPKSVLSLIKQDDIISNVPLVNDSFFHVDNFIIGNNAKALKAGKQYMEASGFKTVILSRKVAGTVKIVADFYFNMLIEILDCLQHRGILKKEKLLKGCCFEVEDNFVDELNRAVREASEPKTICVIAGGEITVELQGDGKGGRSQELALIMSMRMYDLKMKSPDFFDKYNVKFLMAGTDGVDGPTDVAGAIGEADIIKKARNLNLDANKFLINNDSYNFFQSIDGGSYLIKTGHTGTNVMDIHSFLIYQRPTSK